MPVTMSTTMTTWYFWNDQTTVNTYTTATNTTCSTMVWQWWVDGTTNVTAAETPRRVVSEEEYQRLNAERAEINRRYEEAAKETRRKQRRARRKALVLLLRNLAKSQRDELRERKHFHVVGGDTGRKYRIRAGSTIGNVDVLDKDDQVVSRLCAHPGVPCPEGDVLLAQRLNLELDETEFLRRANIHPVQGRIIPPNGATYGVAA